MNIWVRMTTIMEFKQAASFVVPWGDHAGYPIDKVAETDDGLKDLDKLLSWMESKNHKSNFRRNLEKYLQEPSIKKELEGL